MGIINLNLMIIVYNNIHLDIGYIYSYYLYIILLYRIRLISLSRLYKCNYYLIYIYIIYRNNMITLSDTYF